MLMKTIRQRKSLNEKLINRKTLNEKLNEQLK
jgi:hypothetical protein